MRAYIYIHTHTHTRMGWSWLCLSYKNICEIRIKQLTKRTESRAARASISAQETTPLHSSSTALLIVSITSKPLAEFKFPAPSFSLSSPSNRTDPSQPYRSNLETITLWQNIGHIQHLRNQILLTHIHKAIMEVKPNQRSSHSHFVLDGILDLFPHDFSKFWTGYVVEICR